MPALEGQITLVQESRFMLTGSDGVSHLFLLSPSAAAEPAQLAPLAARLARVRVNYAEGDNVIGKIARRIDLLDETAPRHAESAS